MIVRSVAPPATPPNWATILGSFASVASAVAAFVAVAAAIAAAVYAARQHKLAVERDVKAQAEKVAFWGVVEDGHTLRIRYVNTSGLPIWDVEVRPVGALGVRAAYEAFALHPTDERQWLEGAWAWEGTPISGLAESQVRAQEDFSRTAQRMAHIGAVTGGWKREDPEVQVQVLRQEQARLVASFTDAAGTRWVREPNGALRNVSAPPPSRAVAEGKSFTLGRLLERRRK